MRLGPILSGVLGLALLEASLSSDGASTRVGQLLDGIASIVSHVLSPTVPAIPDLRTKSSTTGSSSTSTGSVAPASTSTSSKTVPADWTTSAASLYV
jgi:hypothetical protein